MITSRLSSPIAHGKISQLIREDSAPAGSWQCYFTIESDTVLLSLFVETLSAGSVTVTAWTQTEEGREVPIIAFPVLTGPTTELLLRKAPIALNAVRVEVTTTGTATFELRARAIATGEASVRIEAARSWSVNQITVPAAPTNLIPAALEDRSGLLIKNYLGNAVLFIAENAAKLIAGEGYPLGPGESVGMDVGAGQEVYGESSGAALDVRIVEAGG